MDTAGDVVNTVEVIANSEMYSRDYSACLSDLPVALQWGNMGLVRDSLVLCGGQNVDIRPRDCWTLSSRTGVWKNHTKLIR